MFEPEIFLHCVRLILGGLCAFAAILLCAKKRGAEVVCLAAFVLTNYARTVYQILSAFGIASKFGRALCGVPLLTLAFEAVPPLFLLLALIFFIAKKR